MDAHAATKTHYCKQPGCTNEASSPVGRYSYCAEHQGQGTKASRKFDPATGSTSQRLASLQTLAKQVDRARAKAQKLTTQALQAKQDVEDLETTFQERARELLGDEPERGVRVVA